MEQENQSLFDLQVDQQSISYLGEAARWARFIAIVGFIFCGLMVLMAFFIGTILSLVAGSMNGMGYFGGPALTVIYLIFAAVWFVPCLFLYRFGTQMRAAIRNNQQEKLNNAFGNLKSHFKFIGIVLIIMLALYALAFIGVIIASMTTRV